MKCSKLCSGISLVGQCLSPIQQYNQQYTMVHQSLVLTARDLCHGIQVCLGSKCSRGTGYSVLYIFFYASMCSQALEALHYSYGLSDVDWP